MKNNEPLNRTFYLIFEDSPCWWKYLLKPNFAHLMLMMNDGFNWILIDPSLNTCTFSILPYYPSTDVAEVLRYWLFDPDCTVLKFDIKTYTRFTLWPKLRFLTCMLLIRYLLGVQLPGISPYGIYKNLIKMKSGKKKLKYGKNVISNIEIIKD